MADKEVQLKNGSGRKAVVSSKTTKEAPKTAENVSQSLYDQPGSSKSSGSKVPSSKAAVSASGSSSQSQSGVTMEVMLILKEMNQNLNAQNTRLQKQEERIEFFMSNDPYDGENYEDCESYDQYPESVHDECEESDTHASGKSSDSVFKNLAEKFKQHDATDAEINGQLATFINKSFRDGISDEKQAELMKDIHRPVNCDSLVKTRVNQGIWRLLKANTQAEDSRMQNVQDVLVKASCNLAKLVDKSGVKLDEEEMEWGTNALALLGQANKMINLKRKDMHKSDLDPKYHYLASASLPYTDHLYGEDGDVNKNVRDINDMNRIGRNVGRGYGFNQRGSFRGRRAHPYKRGGFRGRGGFKPRYDPPAKNHRQAPKK